MVLFWTSSDCEIKMTKENTQIISPPYPSACGEVHQTRPYASGGEDAPASKGENDRFRDSSFRNSVNFTPPPSVQQGYAPYFLSSRRRSGSVEPTHKITIDSRLRRNDRFGECGNALWFILIAIALLGLLTVTMTRSSSTSNETGSFEQNQIAASEILTYAKSIENAVQSLLARGCSENEISFWHDSDENGTEDGSDQYYNSGSPTDHFCYIFDIAGAGITYIAPNENWLNTSQSASFYYGINIFWPNTPVDGFGTTANELILVINHVNLSTCLQINNILSITNPSNDAPSDTTTVGVGGVFTGTFSATVADPIGNDAGGHLTGKPTFCVKRTDASPNQYQFVHVLHAR